MELLKDKNILIAGGTGIVGEGIIKVLLREGATVIVPSGSEEKLCTLRENLGFPERLYTPLAEIRSLNGARELLSWMKVELQHLDAVIASIGEWWQGAPLIEISLDTWHKLLESSLTAHFILAKTFLPVLLRRKGSSYTFISGAGGLNAVPHAGPVSVSAAGEIMLKDVLHAENENSYVRINTLILDTPVLTQQFYKEAPEWLTAEDAGNYCAYLISEEAKEVRGETIIFKDRKQLTKLFSKTNISYQEV